MPKPCKINKNDVLALYFHEVNAKEEQNLRAHVDQCGECRDYLATLMQTAHALDAWPEEAPPAGTLDAIMAKLPEAPVTSPATQPALAAAPFVKIISTILGIITVLVFLHDKVTRFPFWETLQEWWLVRLFGPMGVTMVLFFLLGGFITLALAPVYIMDSKARKYRYYFS